jgi:hypothetical protein
MVEIWMVEVDAFFRVKRFGGVPSGSSTTVITLKSRSILKGFEYNSNNVYQDTGTLKDHKLYDFHEFFFKIGQRRVKLQICKLKLTIHEY